MNQLIRLTHHKLTDQSVLIVYNSQKVIMYINLVDPKRGGIYLLGASPLRSLDILFSEGCSVIKIPVPRPYSGLLLDAKFVPIFLYNSSSSTQNF